MYRLWTIIREIGASKARLRNKRFAANPGKCLAFFALLLPLCGSGPACPDGQCEEIFIGTRICGPIGAAAIEKPGLIAENKGKDPDRPPVNPDDDVDSEGISTLGDIFEFIDKNPEKAMAMVQDSAQWPYLTVAAGIIAGHDAVMAGGVRPIPARLRKTLRRWYPDDLLNAVRWASFQGTVKQFLKDARMNFDGDTLAVTLIDVVIFRSDDLANDGALWAHELYHMQQYRAWGVFGFAKRWVDDPAVGGPVEAPAYAREAAARPFFTLR
jgi:hypothetical protein